MSNNIKLSKEAASNIAGLSKETSEKLQNNSVILDKTLEANFSSVEDPAVKKLAELSEKTRELIGKVSQDMEDVANYCNKIIQWMDQYNN